MVDIKPFGEHQGQPVYIAKLGNDVLSVCVLSYGAVTQALRFRGRDLVLGYPDFEGYKTDRFSMGLIAGRCANRIAKGLFSLNGQTYQLAQNSNGHHLHGGKVGFGKRVWKMERDGNSLILHLHSPDGDEGYPAAVDVTLRVSVEGSIVTYQFNATASDSTLINLAQHSYYDLGGPMQLQIAADHYTPVDDTLIPTGEITPVDGAFDYRTARDIDPDLDHNFVLNGPVRLTGQHAALTLTTDQPGVQVYSGRGLRAPFNPNQAICLEPQFFPDAINHPNFAQPIFGPDRPYHQTTRIQLDVPD